ncbi:hypothetical protein Tco_0434660 [Tanacetum coccineum]
MGDSFQESSQKEFNFVAHDSLLPIKNGFRFSDKDISGEYVQKDKDATCNRLILVSPQKRYFDKTSETCDNCEREEPDDTKPLQSFKISNGHDGNRGLSLPFVPKTFNSSDGDTFRIFFDLLLRKL